MSITQFTPDTVYLGGPRVQVNEFAANETITPGMLVERYVSSSKNRWKKHATAKIPGTAVATESSMLNKGIADTYVANDLMEVSILEAGASFYGLVASGHGPFTFGAKLESAGNGKLRAWTDAPQAFVALEAVDNTAGLTDARIRLEVA